MSTNSELRNLVIKHAHYLESYKNKEILEILRLMNGIDRDLKSQLQTYSFKTLTYKRLKLMKVNVKDIITEATEVLSKRTLKSAEEFGYYESEWVVNSLKKTIPKDIPVAYIQPSPTQVLTAIKSRSFRNTTVDAMIADWSKKKIKLFQGAMQQGWVEGKQANEIIKNLFGTRKYNYKDGLVNASKRELATNIRTSLNHMSSVSRELTYKRNKHLIKGVQWVSTLDGATTVICMGLDGLVDMYDGSKNELNGQLPPAHFGCRSTTVPIVKSLKDMGLSKHDYPASTRASMNGQVSDKETYSTWFVKQTDAFQRETLGPSRYTLYKENDYKISSFSANNQKLTLEQLKNKE